MSKKSKNTKEKDKIGQLPSVSSVKEVDYFRPTREIFLKLRWELSDNPPDVF